MNPFPKATPDTVIQTLARSVAEVLSFAGADRHVERDVFRLEFSKDASSHYAKLYRGELRDRSAGERVSGLLDRRAPMLLRLAMIFALTDKTLTIEVRHLEAAMAWVRYWSDSVKFIFQSAMDEVAVAEVNETAKQILEYLKGVGRASRTEVSKGRFNGHVSRERLDAALDELLSATPALIEVETVPRQGKSGSPTKFYKPCANSAKPANYEHPRGFQPEKASCEVSELCELTSDHSSQTSHGSRTAKSLVTRMGIEVSQNSHNSQPISETLVSDADDCEVF